LACALHCAFVRPTQLGAVAAVPCFAVFWDSCWFFALAGVLPCGEALVDVVTAGAVTVGSSAACVTGPPADVDEPPHPAAITPIATAPATSAIEPAHRWVG
jgi:hypothetical protein